MLALLLVSAAVASAAPKPPALPYAADALEPFLSAETVATAYQSQTTVAYDGLAAKIADYDLAHEPGMTAEDYCELALVFPEPIKSDLLADAGAATNQTFFWNGLSPHGGGKPGGTVGPAIKAAFGGLDGLQREFRQAAAGLPTEGGFVWLCTGDRGRVFVVGLAPHLNPRMNGLVPEVGFPLLALDARRALWELDYPGDFDGYFTAFWSKVDWPGVSDRFTAIARYR